MNDGGSGRLLGLALAALVSWPAALAGQEADFLFERPRVSLGLNVGWAAPATGGDLFAETRDFFIIDRRSFDAPYVSGEVAARVTERVDVGVELGWTRGEVVAEDRDFIGSDDLPIVQTTSFTRRPITLNVKAYLFDRGRAISRFAWVPNAWSPWVGAGVGAMFYRFEQEGEFVDRLDPDLTIYQDYLLEEGWTSTFHVMGGADFTLTPRLLLTGQARYGWASDDPDGSFFASYDEIDLAGFQASAGIKVQF